MGAEAFRVVRLYDRRTASHHSYQVVTCGLCGDQERLAITGKIARPPEAVIKTMQHRGWVMGAKRKDDWCVICVQRKAKERSNKMAAIDKPAPRLVTTMAAQPATPPAPADPTREQRRIIILTIEDHYVGADVGYEKGWNDEAVAKHLNVPRKWVADLREDLFGPEGNPELLALTNEVKALDAAVTEATKLVSDLRARLNTIKDRLHAAGVSA